MVLPFNTFTIHSLLGFMTNVSLAVFFYVIYFRLGRRKLDLLSANFIACSAGMCLVSFLTDNLVPAGMPSVGWANGPDAATLALSTLRIQRFVFVFAVLEVVTQLHFILYYCGRQNFLSRHIRWLYAIALAAIPLIWTPFWLAQTSSPWAPTSSWSVAIPWLPPPGPPAYVLAAAFYSVAGYSVWLLWRARRRQDDVPGDLSQRRLVLAAFMFQIVSCLAELISMAVDFRGISFIPLGATVMGIILSVALIRGRSISHRQRLQLELEKAALLESVPQPLLYLDADYCVQWANQAAAASAGTTVEQLCRDTSGSAWAPPESEERRAIDAALRTGMANVREVSRRDGSTWVIHTSPIRDAAGRVPGTVVLALDITRIRWAEEVMKDVNAKILSAAEAERRALAMDLHDSLAQDLGALRLSVALGASTRAFDEDSRGFLARTADRCKDLMQEVRSICHGLYPPTLDSLGLPAALRKALGDRELAGKEFRVYCSQEAEELRFPPEVEIAVFRVAQEAIGNAVHHGQASRIEVDLDYTDGQVVMSVTDNGGGFDPAKVDQAGLGMSTMKSRMKGVGGRLEIASEPGRTRVTACVPCAGTPAGSPNGGEQT